MPAVRYGFSKGNDLHRRISCGNLAHEKIAPLGQADQPNPFSGKKFFQRRGHHAAIPRSPVDAHRPAAGATARLILGKFVQHLVGHGIIDLTGPAEAAGRRSKEGDEAEIICGRGGKERAQTRNLGAVNGGKLLPGFVGYQPVGQHSGAMDDAANRTVLDADLLQQSSHFGTVSDINGTVDHFAAVSGDSLQRPLKLPSGNNLLVALFYFFRVQFAAGMFKDGPLDARLFRQGSEPLRLGGRCRTPAEQQQGRLTGAGQSNRSRGGNAATAAGNDHDITCADRIPGRRRRRRQVNQGKRCSALSRETGLDLSPRQQFFRQSGCRRRLIGEIPQIYRPAGNFRPLSGCRLHQPGKPSGEGICQGGTFKAAEAAVKSGNRGKESPFRLACLPQCRRRPFQKEEGVFQKEVIRAPFGRDNDQSGKPGGGEYPLVVIGRQQAGLEPSLLQLRVELGGQL